MRISDWSSDVCSSDLLESQGVRVGQAVEMFPLGRPQDTIASELSWVASAPKSRSRRDPVKYLSMRAPVPPEAAERLGLVPGPQMRALNIQPDAPAAIRVPNVPPLRRHTAARESQRPHSTHQ